MARNPRLKREPGSFVIVIVASKNTCLYFSVTGVEWLLQDLPDLGSFGRNITFLTACRKKGKPQ
jgi:hypothetical protein